MTPAQDATRLAVAAWLAFLKAAAHEGAEEARQRLAEQPLFADRALNPVADVKPVAQFLHQALAEAAHVVPDFAIALRAIAPQLKWCQSASYSDAVLGEGFSDNYAWAELIGENGFYRAEDFTFGVLLLGPGRHYIDHYHPAPELYVPLTAGSSWRKGESDFIPREPGDIIWHPSMTIHATKTGDRPLLAPYIWTRDVATAARLSVQ